MAQGFATNIGPRGPGGTAGPAGTNITRTRLFGAFTLYVSTTGNDANDGLTLSTPFATIQKAADYVVNNLDLNSNQVTIQLADGTYAQGVVFLPPTGAIAGNAGLSTPLVVLQGNSGNSAAVVLTGANGAAAIFASGPGTWIGIQNMTINPITSGATHSVRSATLAHIWVMGGVVFGATNGGQMQVYANTTSTIELRNVYTISGGAGRHLFAINQGLILLNMGGAATVTGTPAFGFGFAEASGLGFIQVLGSASYSGAATGTRYAVSQNSLITGTSANASFFPGNASGSTSSGGQYL